MNRDEWHRTFLTTLRKLDSGLAQQVEDAGQVFAPVSGAANESAADHAVAGCRSVSEMIVM